MRRSLHPLAYSVLWLLLCIPAAMAEEPLSRSDFASASSSFLPVDQAYQLQAALLDGRPLLRWTIAEGYYLYRHALDFQFHPATGAERTAPAALGTSTPWQHEAQLPDGYVQDDPYFGRVETYYHDLTAELAVLPADGILAVTYQGCADGGLCYPPQTDYFQVDLATGSVEPTTAPESAVDAPGVNASVAATLSMALLAGLGGLLLNLMPCVFPVLSLKVMSFAQDRDRSLARHGLSYTAGVILSFILAALAMVILTRAGRAVGWGFQLQSPVFIGALTYLFLALGLSLSGFWTLAGRWTGLGQQWTARHGYLSSFATGILAVIVASPCTAPFMGTALGFASTQPLLPALSVFAGLGIGMALPMLLLCLFPAWLQRLPRPGPWMLRLQQLLAFPLYATAIWLLWVLGRQAGVDAMATLLGGGLLLVLALWLWRFGLLARSIAAAALAFALALLNSPLMTLEPATAPMAGNDHIEPYSAARLAELRAAGEPVFVNVTADWCLTCLANERVALSSQAVRQAFAAANIHYLKADWTRYDPTITELLNEHGRNGVPLYLYFAPGREASILPQLLTPQRVVMALGLPDMPQAFLATEP